MAPHRRLAALPGPPGTPVGAAPAGGVAALAAVLGLRKERRSRQAGGRGTVTGRESRGCSPSEAPLEQGRPPGPAEERPHVQASTAAPETQRLFTLSQDADLSLCRLEPSSRAAAPAPDPFRLSSPPTPVTAPARGACRCRWPPPRPPAPPAWHPHGQESHEVISLNQSPCDVVDQKKVTGKQICSQGTLCSAAPPPAAAQERDPGPADAQVPRRLCVAVGEETHTARFLVPAKGWASPELILPTLRDPNVVEGQLLELPRELWRVRQEASLAPCFQERAPRCTLHSPVWDAKSREESMYFSKSSRSEHSGCTRPRGEHPTAVW